MNISKASDGRLALTVDILEKKFLRKYVNISRLKKKYKYGYKNTIQLHNVINPRRSIDINT